MSRFRVSKVDASRRQLETAINLFFYERDVVSIHTLSAAAFNILSDIGRHKGIDKKTVRGWVLEQVKADRRKFLLGKLKEAENFFKHADRDADAFLSFNPGQTEFIIWDCIITYQTMTGESTPLFKIFHLWYALQHREFFDLSDEQKIQFDKSASATHGMDRKTFFETLLPEINKLPRPVGSEA
jgi:hypothetical protein